MERGRGGGLSRWKTTGAFDGERAIVEHYCIKENCIYVNLFPQKKGDAFAIVTKGVTDGYDIRFPICGVFFFSVFLCLFRLFSLRISTLKMENINFFETC